MSNKPKQVFQTFNNLFLLEIIENISLKNYNTFNIEAYASNFVSLDSQVGFKELFEHKIYQQKAHFILGGGSNILFTKNFDGLVIHNNIKGIEILNENDDEVYVKFGAGEVWHNCVLYCIKNGFGGIENLSLIPGYIGAAPMQNIGAYGVELKDVFESLEAINLQSGAVQTFKNAECNFGYRESIFKNKVKDKYLITSVTLKLQQQPKFNISYGAIEKTLAENRVQELSIKAISDAVIQIRQSKLPNPKVIGNAGSFFKNPVVKNEIALKIKKDFPAMPSYPANNKTKIPAGWLIDQCGFKGKVVGQTGTYKNQALVLVNRGKATGEEVLSFSTKIQAEVLSKFGISLEREVNVV